MGPQEGLTWDTTDTPNGERWAARLEIYETDPRVEPDMTKWVTQLDFRLAGRTYTTHPTHYEV